jgi:hypothetical protein
MIHSFYSQRTGLSPHPDGLPLSDVIDLFVRIFNQMRADGYFDEAFGYDCVDAGIVSGTVRDPSLEILLTVRKRDLWPIQEQSTKYSEDDFFDVIEFLFLHVSKPLSGSYHSWNNCGMHWNTFDIEEGRKEFCEKINIVLGHYENAFELSPNGEVLHKPDHGFESIFIAELPLSDDNVTERVIAATLRFRNLLKFA